MGLVAVWPFVSILALDAPSPRRFRLPHFLVRVRCWFWSSRAAAVSFVLNVGSLSGVDFHPSRLALVLVARGGFVSFGGGSLKCSKISFAWAPWLMPDAVLGHRNVSALSTI